MWPLEMVAGCRRRPRTAAGGLPWRGAGGMAARCGLGQQRDGAGIAACEGPRRGLLVVASGPAVLGDQPAQEMGTGRSPCPGTPARPLASQGRGGTGTGPASAGRRSPVRTAASLPSRKARSWSSVRIRSVPSVTIILQGCHRPSAHAHFSLETRLPPSLVIGKDLREVPQPPTFTLDTSVHE